MIVAVIVIIVILVLVVLARLQFRKRSRAAKRYRHQLKVVILRQHDDMHRTQAEKEQRARELGVRKLRRSS
jgi:type II secretory pathway pseudopilin PulG